MSNASRCNGVNDCGDGSDEQGCGKIMPEYNNMQIKYVIIHVYC